MGSPKVFVSYSHDSEEHKGWVKNLCTKLRKNGVDVILDEWDLRPGMDRTVFMEELRNSDRVLIVCTNNYVEKANNRESGVGYEGVIITAELAQNLKTNKFIPIIRQASGKNNTPIFLGTRVYSDLRDDSQFDVEFDKLLREILNIPINPKPPLGKNPFIKQTQMDDTLNREAANILDQIEPTSHIENSQVIEHQIQRIEERTNALCATNEPNLIVIVKPTSSCRPLISKAEIYEVARKDLAPVVAESALRSVEGGTCFLIGGEKPYNCLELNDHGIVYYRQDVRFGIEEKDIFLPSIVWAIGFGIEYARSLYEKCESLENLEITARLHRVSGKRLRLSGAQRDDELKRHKSLDSEIPASIQCSPGDIVGKEKVIDIVNDLIGQLAWPFDYDNTKKIKELIEGVLEANKLLPN